MLLTAGILLGLVSAYFEIALVKNSPALLDFMTRFKKLPLPMLFSVVLSILLGMAFGAVGVTVLLGGIFSTCLTQPYYWWHSPEGQLARQRKIQPVKRAYQQTVRVSKQTARVSKTVNAPVRSMSYLRRTWAKK